MISLEFFIAINYADVSRTLIRFPDFRLHSGILIAMASTYFRGLLQTQRARRRHFERRGNSLACLQLRSNEVTDTPTNNDFIAPLYYTLHPDV